MELQALVFKLSGKKRNKTRGTIHRHKTPRIVTLDDLSNGGGGGTGEPVKKKSACHLSC